MAIKVFDGTTSGSDSGWTRRFYSELVGGDGHCYRIEIIDSESASGTFSQSETTATWLDLHGDGFLIEYDGEDDNRHTPLVPSSCTITVVTTDQAHHEFVTAVQTNRDHRFGIAVFVHEPDNNSGASGSTTFADATGWWKPIWFGTIFTDQSESEHLKDIQTFSVTAQCGLVLLNDEPFIKDDGTRWTDIQPLSRQIGRCLAKLPTASLWGWNEYDGRTTVYRDYNHAHVERTLSEKPKTPFFREMVWILDKVKHVKDVTIGETTVELAGGASVLDHTRCDSNAFTETSEAEDPLGGIVRSRKFTSCSEVLANIAGCLGARIFLSHGSWWFQNPDGMIATTRREFIWYDQYQLKAVNATNGEGSPVTNSTHTKPLDLFDTGFNVSGKTKTSVLFPARLVESIHDDGGSRQIASFSGETNITYTTAEGTSLYGSFIYFEKVTGQQKWECLPITAVHDDVVIEGGESFNISGNIKFTHLGKYISYGPSEWNDLFSENARGARYLVELTIKCGNYYLKRNITTRSETVRIENAIGSLTNTQKFEEQTGDIEWTLTESTYDFTVPRIGSQPDPPVATVEVGGEVVDADFPGGFHTRLRSNGEEFKVVEGVTGDTDDESKFELNWNLPPTPEGVTHTGISVTCNVKVMKSDHTVISGTLVRDFFSANDENQYQAFYLGTSPLKIGECWLTIYSGEGQEDSEVSFIAEADKNTSRIVTAKSIFGDKYAIGATTRALTLEDCDTHATSYAEGNWVTLDNVDANGKYLHQLLADETLQKRHNPLEVRKTSHEFVDMANFPAPLSNLRSSHDVAKFAMTQFQRPLKFAYTNGVTEFFEFLTLAFNNSISEYVIAKCKTSRDLTSITQWDTTNDVRGPEVTVGGGGTTPISGFELQPATGGQTQRGIAALRRSQAGSNITVSGIKTKTDFITVSGTGVTNITGDGTFVRADNVQTSQSRTFATSAQLTAIADNTLNITNVTSDVSDIQDKTDLLTVTQQHNLDSTKQTVSHITADATGISSFTIKAGTTPIRTDEIDDASQSNKFATVGQLTKVNYLSVTDATDLDNVRRKVSPITINASQKITSLDVSGSSVISMDNVNDGVTRVGLLATERSQKLNNILGTSTGIAAFAVAAGYKPLTADQVNDASTTAKFTNADGVTKLGNMTLNANDKIESLDIAGAYGGGTRTMDLGEMHDLMAGNYPSGTCPTTYGYLCTIAQSVNDAATANRSAQTGNVVALIDADGKFQSLDDGSANQFLKTDGSGVVQWATPKAVEYVLATISTRATLYYQDNIYIGSAAYGWMFYSWTFNISSSTLSLLAAYAHCAIIAPEAFTKLRVRGTVKNDTAQNDTNILILHGSRPSGSTSNITLTELGSGTAATSTTQDAHEDVDFLLSGLTVAAGDMIVVGFQRTTGGTGTQYVQASLTISITP